MSKLAALWTASVKALLAGLGIALSSTPGSAAPETDKIDTVSAAAMEKLRTIADEERVRIAQGIKPKVELAWFIKTPSGRLRTPAEQRELRRMLRLNPNLKYQEFQQQLKSKGLLPKG